MNANDRPTAEQWATAFNLRKRGGEYVGACPLCGGVDRLRANAHGLFCRACLPNGEDGARYGEMLQRAGLATPPATPPRSRRGGGRRDADYRRQRRAIVAGYNKRMAAAGDLKTRAPAPTTAPAANYEPPPKIWTASMRIEGTAGEVYLTQRRRVWRADAEFPDAVRWLPVESMPALRMHAPNGIAGAVVWRHVDAKGEVAAVQAEGITHAGEQSRPRWRRTFGLTAGALCAVGMRGGNPVVVVEGEVSAMAAVWLADDGAQIIAAGSASRLRKLASAIAPVAHGRRIEIWTDNDAIGRDAGRALAADLRAGGVDVVVQFHHCTTEQGSDAADLLNLKL